MSADVQEDVETYAIVCHYRGYAEVILADGLQLALRGFLMNARIIADLFPKNMIAFLGNDVDSGLPSLTMTVDGRTMMSLQQPGRIDGKNVVNGQLVDVELPKLPHLDNQNSFAAISAWLSWLYMERDPHEAVRRQKTALHTWPALHLSRDYIEILARLASESVKDSRTPAPSGDKDPLRKAIDSIRLMVSAIATVR